jgi:hypothetical protein
MRFVPQARRPAQSGGPVGMSVHDRLLGYGFRGSNRICRVAAVVRTGRRMRLRRLAGRSAPRYGSCRHRRMARRSGRRSATPSSGHGVPGQEREDQPAGLAHDIANQVHQLGFDRGQDASRSMAESPSVRPSERSHLHRCNSRYALFRISLPHQGEPMVITSPMVLYASLGLLTAARRLADAIAGHLRQDALSGHSFSAPDPRSETRRMRPFPANCPNHEDRGR